MPWLTYIFLIQFFEHGSSSQRRELADQLFGHALALSLQMYGCRVIQKVIHVHIFSKFHKFFYFKKILGLLTKAYTCMHITEGNRGGWPGPEDKNGYWAWWSYHEMRAWSKWKPCYPEMYWMYTRRFGSVYYLDILRSSCSTVHSPLWLQSHTGWSFNSELSNSSTLILSLENYLSSTLVKLMIFFLYSESAGALHWSKNTANCYGWNIAICMHVSTRPIWKLCCPGLLHLTNFRLISGLMWHSDKKIQQFCYSYIDLVWI
jgi:hypothetical protein